MIATPSSLPIVPVPDQAVPSAPSLLRRNTQRAMHGIAVMAGLGIILSSLSASSAGLLAGLAVGIVCVAVGFVWAQSQVRQASKSLENLQTIAHQLAQTHLDGRTTSNQGDDVAVLASLMLQFVDRIEELQRQLASATGIDPQVQQNLQEVLRALDRMAEGNLTVTVNAEGEVGERANRAINAIALTIKNLQLKSQAVGTELESLQTLAEELNDRAQRLEATLQRLQTEMQPIAELVGGNQQQETTATDASQLAVLAVKEAEQGIVSLTDSINSLQQGTGLIVQRIRNLDEFVTLAKQFVLDQKRLASLTQVLAMNASMVAARALEQREPDQFASVAREFAAIATQVNNLATQTNQGLVVLQQRTGFVEVVVSGIDRDVQDVNGLVTQFRGSVEQSQQTFDYLKRLADQVTKVEEAVLATNQTIRGALQKTLDSASTLEETSELIAEQIRQTQTHSQTLREQSKELHHLIAKFSLPS
jgi:twitching motility protein PilJ